jgi:hypothetical protein
VFPLSKSQLSRQIAKQLVVLGTLEEYSHILGINADPRRSHKLEDVLYTAVASVSAFIVYRSTRDLMAFWKNALK